MSEIQKGSEIIDCGNSCERRGNQCPFWGWDAGYFQTFITKCRLKNKLNGKVVVPEVKWKKAVQQYTQLKMHIEIDEKLGTKYPKYPVYELLKILEELLGEEADEG